MSQLWAAAHPGKMGDALYCLPVLRYFYGKDGTKFDFYTSSYCAPLQTLFEYQPYIHKFIIAEDYVLQRTDMGCQPWMVPIHQPYDKVLQLGFQSIPDTMLHQSIAKTAGVNEPLAIHYEHPTDSWWLESVLEQYPDGYICIAPRSPSSFQATFDELAQRTSSVIIGAPDDYNNVGVNMTGLDMLQTLVILSRAKAFVGLMSSQLVLANGFNIPRIAPWDGKSWDMRHALKYHLNHYPVHPTVDQILTLI